MSVNITGVDKVALLHALWKNQKTACFFNSFNAVYAPSFNVEAAQEAVKTYIDYFCGRAIKCDLSGDTVSPDLYDRDVSNGKFAAVVQDMKA